MSEIIKKKLSESPIQSADEIQPLSDWGLTLDDDTGLKIKRIKHSEMQKVYLENHVIGAKSGPAIITNAGEQTLSDKILIDCILKDCLFAQSPPGSPTLTLEEAMSETIEVVQASLTGMIDTAVQDAVATLSRAGIGATAFLQPATQMVTANEILAAAGMDETYCIPIANILSVIAFEVVSGYVVPAKSYFRTKVNLATGEEDVECLNVLELGDKGEIDLYVRFIAETVGEE